MEILFPFLIARLMCEFKLGATPAIKALLGGTVGWAIPWTTAQRALTAWLASVCRILAYKSQFEIN